jgi:glucose-6-phosphate dehydrogenase assembly protein OpcA
MRQITRSTPQQIKVDATLDVQSVERELSRLWKENTGASEGEGEDESAVMRARVLNLMVYISRETALEEVNRLLSEITSAHPCRVLVLLAENAKPDEDIEMFVSAHCFSTGGGGVRNLCGEQLTLKAQGRFTVELPSACVPLLVPDLPIFLWWRDAPRLGDETFASLMHAADRVIIDSVAFRNPYEDILGLVSLLGSRRRDAAAISDLNWARLTSWRTLMACFYDVEEYRASLDHIERVRVEYVPHGFAPDAIAPKALILAGWLASRLGWRVPEGQTLSQSGASGEQSITLERDGHSIELQFAPVERPSQMQGWIARLELSATEPFSSRFVVLRSRDGRYLETEVTVNGQARSSRRLTGGDKSEAELLARELEIISHDRIYEEAISAAAAMLRAK